MMNLSTHKELYSLQTALVNRVVRFSFREIMPGSPPWDGFKWRDRTRWAFRKSKVNALVGEIEHLESTLNLLLQTMTLARQKFLAPDKDQRYTIRAKQALYEQFKASEELSMLRKQDAAEVQHSAAPGKGSSTSSSTGVLAAYDDPVLSASKREYLSSNTSPETRAARLHGESSQWLDRMRAEWFDGDHAESHLSLGVVRKESKPSSGDRNEKNSKLSEQYEGQIRMLRDQLAESYRDRQNDQNEFRLMLNREMEKQQKQSDEMYERLKAEHRLYERRNQEDSTVRQSANEECLERLIQELNMRTRVHEQQMQETGMMYEQQIQQMEQEMYRRR
jgi:hypothetical protein